MRLMTLAIASAALLAGAVQAKQPAAFDPDLFESAAKFMSVCGANVKLNAATWSNADATSAAVCSAYMTGAYDAYSAARASPCPAITMRQMMTEATRIYAAQPSVGLGQLVLLADQSVCKP